MKNYILITTLLFTAICKGQNNGKVMDSAMKVMKDSGWRTMVLPTENVYYGSIRFEKAKPDTISIVMLVTDMSLMGLAKSIEGYVVNSDGINKCYLDKKKNRLPTTMVIWNAIKNTINP